MRNANSKALAPLPERPYCDEIIPDFNNLTTYKKNPIPPKFAFSIEFIDDLLSGKQFIDKSNFF